MQVTWWPTVKEVDIQICDFHRENPGQAYHPACLCSSTCTTRNKSVEEWTERETRRWVQQFTGAVKS